jgi:hypothetical protein
MKEERAVKNAGRTYFEGYVCMHVFMCDCMYTHVGCIFGPSEVKERAKMHARIKTWPVSMNICVCVFMYACVSLFTY